eukprot:scaffold228968_cov20-Tisochrysis_lutea.AAC.1
MSEAQGKDSIAEKGKGNIESKKDPNDLVSPVNVLGRANALRQAEECLGKRQNKVVSHQKQAYPSSGQELLESKTQVGRHGLHCMITSLISGISTRYWTNPGRSALTTVIQPSDSAKLLAATKVWFLEVKG